MASGAPASGHAFLRGERRLTVPEYVGLVASCQAAFDAAMSELPPSSQVDLWNARAVERETIAPPEPLVVATQGSALRDRLARNRPQL